VVCGFGAWRFVRWQAGLGTPYSVVLVLKCTTIEFTFPKSVALLGGALFGGEQGQYGMWMGIQGDTINGFGCGPKGPSDCSVGTTPGEHWARRGRAGNLKMQQLAAQVCVCVCVCVCVYSPSTKLIHIMYIYIYMYMYMNIYIYINHLYHTGPEDAETLAGVQPQHSTHPPVERLA
jgi:hypothetical protein